jgi:hypothetical protein
MQTAAKVKLMRASFAHLHQGNCKCIIAQVEGCTEDSRVEGMMPAGLARGMHDASSFCQQDLRVEGMMPPLFVIQKQHVESAVLQAYH